MGWIKNLFQDYKDLIIEDQSKTIHRLLDANKEQAELIFKLYDIIHESKKQ